MPGLDPGIHAVPEARNSVDSTSGAAWMPRSSPGMTIWGLRKALPPDPAFYAAHGR